MARKSKSIEPVESLPIGEATGMGAVDRVTKNPFEFSVDIYYIITGKRVVNTDV